MLVEHPRRAIRQRGQLCHPLTSFENSGPMFSAAEVSIDRIYAGILTGSGYQTPCVDARMVRVNHPLEIAAWQYA
jgi:hypothetical protein